ncbi:hypothetical protein EDD16DRAFT_1518336 [Pisolithus croceorrhizus]|nr:hypothetical protein EDD16DRAFT_1518336 [Pisolithus croceorrhizus]
MEIGWLTFDNKDLGVLDSSGIGAGQWAYLGGSKGGPTCVVLPVGKQAWMNGVVPGLGMQAWMGQSMSRQHTQWWAYLGDSEGGHVWVSQQVGNTWDSKPTCAVLRVGIEEKRDPAEEEN